MDEDLIPTGDADAEFVEKKSRFIGHVFRVETEEEALAHLKRMRETYWDASHNVYAYIIRGGTTRYSDDGGQLANGICLTERGEWYLEGIRAGMLAQDLIKDEFADR